MTQTGTAPIGSTDIWFGIGRRAAKPADGAGILLRYTDEFGTWMLLSQRARFLTFPGTWANPGGSIDPGETELAAALRELHEELGIEAAAIEGKLTKTVVMKDRVRTYTTFVIDLDSDDIEVLSRLPHETAAVEWVLPEHMDAMPLHPGFREVWNAIR